MESDNTSTALGGQDAVLDEACRILTISASVDAGKEFVELIKARSSSSSSQTPSSSSTPSTSTSIPHIVPYTLSNRYYTADLHFALWPLDGLVVSSSPHFHLPNHGEETKLPPAVIFVWVDGEPYAKHVEQLSQTLQSGGYEPEVCLAVRIPKADMSGTPSATQAGTSPENKDANLQEDEDEDNANIDSTLMSFGFEYVDATQQHTRPRSERRDVDDDDIDIPGLPRVFDALSTIMWPSMRTPAISPSSKAKGNTNGQRITTRSPHSVAQQQERIAIMEELLSVSEISGLGGWSGSVMIGQEIEVVDGESDEEEVGTPVDFSYGFERKRSGVPWLGGTRKSTLDQTGLSFEGEGELSTSPTDIHGLSPFGEMGPGSGSGKKISIGFEDDFTVFVSAPPPGASPNTSMEGIVEEDGETVKDGLGHELHLRADASSNPYRSLGSVSDFGDGEDEQGYQELDEVDEDQEGWEDRDEKEWDEEGDNESWDVDEEEGLPSKEEIRQTAARIFGGISGPSPGPGGGEKEKAKGIFAKASDVLKEQQDQEPSPSTKKGKDTSAEMKERMRRLGGMAAAADIRGAFGSEGQEEEEGGGFDLERVLHSLQAMRSEIGDIEDEDEKRKMAARVALGLVYGLDGMDAG